MLTLHNVNFIALEKCIQWGLQRSLNVEARAMNVGLYHQRRLGGTKVCAAREPIENGRFGRRILCSIHFFCNFRDR